MTVGHKANGGRHAVIGDKVLVTPTPWRAVLAGRIKEYGFAPAVAGGGTYGGISLHTDKTRLYPVDFH